MTATTVRYARWDGVGRPFTVVEEETDPAALTAGQALVAVDLASVCGSDVHTVLGHRDSPSPASWATSRSARWLP
jgi:threonine dehydrogenase-like Zn-dependent dehydrogenase